MEKLAPIKTLEVIYSNIRGGGEIRTFNIIKHRKKTNILCNSLLLLQDRILSDHVRDCPPLGYVRLKKIIDRIPPSLKETTITILPNSLAFNFKLGKPVVDIVISHQEPPDFLRAALWASSITDSKSLAILHSPPIYGDPRRSDAINKAIDLYYHLVKRYASTLTGYTRIIYWRSRRYQNKILYKLVESYLRRFNLIIAVSPSTPLEMGEEWVNKIVSLKPGVGFEVEELEYLRMLKASRQQGSKPYAVFSARLVAEKGLGDLILASKLIAREYPHFKLLITGRTRAKVRHVLERIIDKLGLKDNIVLLGYLPRLESFKVRAGAKFMIYPSHEDAYSYSVAESLLMGVPVVAYDIPGLKLNYNGIEGLELVREGDIEALAQKAIEILEAKRVHVEEPRVKTSYQVALEERAIIDRLVNG